MTRGDTVSTLLDIQGPRRNCRVILTPLTLRCRRGDHSTLLLRVLQKSVAYHHHTYNNNNNNNNNNNIQPFYFSRCQ